MPHRPTVLLLCDDPFATALLGLLAEQSGCRPMFGRANERPEETLARVRHPDVVLVDAALPAVESDLFFGLAARRRVGLAILTRQDNGQRPSALVLDRDIPCFHVPTDADQFTRVLDAASASGWWRSGAERRASPRLETGLDGAIVLVDRTGTRWTVYDRRGGERRAAADRDGAERIFVDTGGQVWGVPLGRDPAEDVSPVVLERQLARATRRPSSG